MAHRTHLGEGKGLLLVATASLEDTVTRLYLRFIQCFFGLESPMLRCPTFFGLESPFIMPWLVGLDNLFSEDKQYGGSL